MPESRWRYQDPSGEYVVTEADILRDYWPYWCEQMRKVGKDAMINHENCIEDFVVVHWAQADGPAPKE
jgi:hypothetical protein